MMISLSWLELKPNEVENGNEEEFESYFPRIEKKEQYNHIPKCVFEQWIHPHHSNLETLNNYAWMDYEKIIFEEQSWKFEDIANVHVVEKYYRNKVSYRKCFNSFEEFLVGKEPLSYWKEKGTWKTPPIILDVKSLTKETPNWSEIVGPYQLVEGHTRFGHLFSMKNVSDLGKGQIAESHKIWLMKDA